MFNPDYYFLKFVCVSGLKWRACFLYHLFLADFEHDSFSLELYNVLSVGFEESLSMSKKTLSIELN